MNLRQPTILAAATILFASCTTQEPAVSSTACDEAADVVEQCSGERPTPPETCDGETARAAEQVRDGGCAALEDGKDDWSFRCSSLTRWLGTCNIDPSANTEVLDDLEAITPMGTFEGTGYWGNAVDRTNGDPKGERGACNVSTQIDRNEHGTSLVVTMTGETFGVDDEVQFRLNDYDRIELREFVVNNGYRRVHVHHIPEDNLERYESQTLTVFDQGVAYDHTDELGIYWLVIENDGVFSCKFDLR